MNCFRGYTVLIFFLFVFFVYPAGSQISKIDSLTSLTGSQEGEELASTYLQLAKEYLYIAPDKALEVSQKAFHTAIESKKPELRSLANLTLGSAFTMMGDFEKGKSYIDEGLRIAKKINHAEHICTGLNALAVYHMNTGDYNKAISLFYECAAHAKTASLEKQEAMVRFNIGAILTNMGKWAKGLKEFKYALEYFQKAGAEQFISRTMMNIAVNYSSWGDYEMALSYYRKSLDHLKRVGDMSGEASALNNMGEIYKDTGNYEKALEYYQESLDIALKMKSKLHEAVPLIGKGEVYWLMKDDDRSEQYSKKALEIFQSMQMTEGIARSYHILGEVALARNKIEEASGFAFKSKELADGSGIKDLQAKVLLLISKIYEKDGKTAQAFKYFKEYSTVNDSLFNEKHSEQLTQFRSELELQDKESQIEILQKDNQIKDYELKKQRHRVLMLLFFMLLLSVGLVTIFSLNRMKKKVNALLLEKNSKILEQHEELIKLNETKDMFLTIIGHDLRNPIGAFKDTLDQLADYPDMFPEDVRRELIGELRKEAESTYFLLDNMLIWAKNQKNCIQFKPEPLRISELIENNILLNKRFAENKNIKIGYQPEGNYIVLADQNMVSLILRNLFSNAIKFTRPGGEVNIMLQLADDNFVEISVADNGVGIPDELKDQLFNKHRHTSTYGTNYEKGSGLGLMLCSSFVEQNGGDISVESVVGEGSTFRFTLKRYLGKKD
ncbi:MAG: tetratricopeptide repeat-containing sensor histidine kinase [Prolixibacteraceae bacterium]|jgi:signal transduction histidine kinase/Tfp pilus assembly protein PilF|nr:tetratricopeptide repeat-containing sensor histidine kinase [Prolixibacteraceae bacterium]